MKPEVFEILLNEILEEQKKETISNAEMIMLLKKLIEQMEASGNREQFMEILDELKETNRLNRENTRIAMEQEKRLAILEKRLGSQQPDIDVTQLGKTLVTKLDNITDLVASQPHEIIQTRRILLFPEHNTIEFYKVFYGRFVRWFAIVLLGCFLYALGRDYIVASQQSNWYKTAYEQMTKEKQENRSKSKPKSGNSSGNSH